MGLGGNLMWTPVIRELKNRYTDRNIVLVKSCGRKFSKEDLLKKNSLMRDLESDVFLNNPYLSRLDTVKSGDNTLFMDLVLRDSAYHAKATREKVVFKNEGHIIDIFGRSYGLTNLDKKCDLFLTSEEKHVVASHVSNFGNFITIEPHSKDSFTPNRAWGFDKWQKVVDRLCWSCKIIQVGVGGKPVLRNVYDATGKFSFRETAGLIGESCMFLSTEGGLVHAANAVNTKSIVVYSGYQPVNVTEYPGNTNLAPNYPCFPCGLLTKCSKGLKCADTILPEMVINAVKSQYLWRLL